MKIIVVILGLLLLFALYHSCEKNGYNQNSTIYGLVTDNATGEPVAGATVALFPLGTTQTTGADGSYEFSDLDPKLYTITVKIVGYQMNDEVVKVVVDEVRTETNINLTKI